MTTSRKLRIEPPDGPGLNLGGILARSQFKHDSRRVTFFMDGEAALVCFAIFKCYRAATKPTPLGFGRHLAPDSRKLP